MLQTIYKTWISVIHCCLWTWAPSKKMVGRLLSFETVPFSGEMLVFEGVHFLDCNVFFTRMWLFGGLGAFCLNKEHKTGVLSSYPRLHQCRENSPRDFPKKVLELGKNCTLTLHGTSPYPTRLDFFFSGKPSLELWCSGTMLCNRWVRRSPPGLLELLGTARFDRDFWFGRP